MRFNISKFYYYPYQKTNLQNCNFPMKLIQSFQKSYNNLPYDEYIPDKTRQRRYANYLVQNIKDNNNNNNNKFSIQHTNQNKFQQNVDDSRKDERIFQLIENPYHPFLLNFITLAAELTHTNNYSMIDHLFGTYCRIDYIDEITGNILSHNEINLVCGEFFKICKAIRPNAGEKKGFQKRNKIKSYFFLASLLPVLNHDMGLIVSIERTEG